LYIVKVYWTEDVKLKSPTEIKADDYRLHTDVSKITAGSKVYHVNMKFVSMIEVEWQKR